MELGYGWFHPLPVHPCMGEFDKEIAWKAIPIALEETLKQLRGPRKLSPYEKWILGVNNLSDFKPVEPYDNAPGTRTKKELFEYIKKMLREGIKPAKGYVKDIYVIEDFPFSFGHLKIENGYSLQGPGSVSLLKGYHWYRYLNEETFKSIPEETLETLLDEFRLKYEFHEGADNPHCFRQLPLEKPKVWYVVDSYKEQKLFAYNFIVAYTNLFLKELSRLDFPEDFQEVYKNLFLSSLEGR